MKENAVVITRQHLGSWGSFVGSIGLLLGAIGLIWQSGITPIIAVFFVAGIAGIALWGTMTPDDFKAFISGRQARYSTGAVFSTLLLIGIVALTYIILQRSVLTLDMTLDSRFTLSPESKILLSRVTQPMQITGFYSPANLAIRDLDDTFFRAYEVETNGLIRRQYINPEEEPATAAVFDVRNDGDVFLSFLNPDGTVNPDTIRFVPRGARQERDMSTAIARMLVTQNYIVYFETGRGALSPIDATQQSLSELNNAIRENGLITNPLNLSEIVINGGSIPSNAAALILARPTSDLSAEEVLLISNYLAQGGGLLVLADVQFGENTFLGTGSPLNDYLWTTFGIRAGSSVIVDPSFSIQTALDLTVAAVYTDTPMGARFDQRTMPSLFRIVRSLDVNNTPPPNISNGRVVVSSPDSYGETNLQALAQTNDYARDAQDIAGPLDYEVWAFHHQTGARVVMFGDSDFATNGFTLRASGNAVLLVDAISWVTNYSDAIIFDPISATVTPVLISGQILDLLAFATVIVMPSIVLAIGLWVWRKRVAAQ
jgi:ABC-type uncharacterized transport system involved in gliding motility auxiliary subunit